MKIYYQFVFFLFYSFICLENLYANSTEMIKPSGKKLRNERPNYHRSYVSAFGTQEAYTSKEVVQKSVFEAMWIFRAWFNITIETTDQLVEVAAVLIADYYNKLRVCMPGVYRYPIPNALFGWRINNEVEPKYFLATSTILGRQDTFCMVNTTITMRHNLTRIQCAYSPNSLNFFTDKKALKAARNDIRYKKQDREDIAKINLECTVS